LALNAALKRRSSTSLHALEVLRALLSRHALEVLCAFLSLHGLEVLRAFLSLRLSKVLRRILVAARSRGAVSVLNVSFSMSRSRYLLSRRGYLDHDVSFEIVRSNSSNGG
jgi:hypothetical protein